MYSGVHVLVLPSLMPRSIYVRNHYISVECTCFISCVSLVLCQIVMAEIRERC